MKLICFDDSFIKRYAVAAEQILLGSIENALDHSFLKIIEKFFFCCFKKAGS